ncbi:MAG: hypothetical protein CBE07_003430 [Pelagibacteraceae bacterium TMED247]|nr:MAG: hypothetical protein CBE07_003430 [Pelagibacteraceae bacterium TMED247]|tara:strand:+ start:4723 stop:5316 length:594 start_codon:yes stop_codon:yes gene_type:complete
MPLWGATDSDESKPKHLTTAQKKEVFANASGWVVEAGSTQSGNGNTSATPEVLVAIGGLATSLGSADITEIDWITTAADKSDGFSLSVRVFFNEPVDVDTSGGTPYLAVTNGNEGSGSGRGPHNLPYASGTGTNELVFTLAIAADNAATNADDVLSIGANAMNLNSGTIKDAGTATASTITNSSSIGSDAGTLTVTA